MEFLQVLLTISALHLLAAMSPGPDFVLVSQLSLRHGRQAGLLCSLGIALGLSVHILYSAAGLALVLNESSGFILAIKIAAACYLFYLGWQVLGSEPSIEDAEQPGSESGMSPGKALLQGFLCNVLNPKAPLYFLAVFSLAVSPDIVAAQWWLLGISMMVIQFLWFATVATVLSRSVLRARYLRHSRWINTLMGVLLIVLGFSLVVSSATT